MWVAWIVQIVQMVQTVQAVPVVQTEQTVHNALVPESDFRTHVPSKQNMFHGTS